MATISPLLLSRIIGQITGAMRNLRMYDVKHATSQKLIESSLAAVKEGMASEPSFSFTLAGNILQVNGKPVPDSRKEAIANFIGELGKRSIGQLTFTQGLDRDQLQYFFEAMALEPEQVKAQGGLSRILASRRVTNILIKGISYGGDENMALPEGVTAQDLDTLSKMPAQLMAMIRSNPAQVAKLILDAAAQGGDEAALSQLDNVAGMMAGSMGLGSADYIAGMTGVIGSLGANVQREFLSNKAMDREWGEIIKNILGRLPDAEIFSMLNGRLVKLKKQGFAGDWADEVKKFWEGLPIDFARKDTLKPTFKQKLAQYGFGEDDQRYIMGEEASGEQKAAQLLQALRTQPPAQSVSPQFLNQLRRALNRGGATPEVWNEYWKKLADPDAAVRRLAIQNNTALIGDLAQAGRFDVIELLIVKFTERLMAETSPELQPGLILGLNQTYDLMIAKDKKAIAGTISKSIGDLFPYLVDKPVGPVLIEVLARMGDEAATRALIKGFTKDAVFEKIAGLLAANGMKAAPWLIDTVRESEDRTMRMKTMYVLSKIGPEVEDLAIKMLPDDRWFVKRNMALLLAQLGSIKSVEPLKVQYDDKDARVRSEIMKTVFKLAGAKAEVLYLKGLADKEPDVRKLAIECLAKCPTDTAVDAMAAVYSKRDMLGRGEAPEIKKAVIAACGEIGSKKAASFLMGAARDKDPDLAAAAGAILPALLKKLKEQGIQAGSV
ncbi:MAG TPA: HEAT repeat domain-containing protein [Candidatus Edwardsbacteria bacterium]|nr:HEAT repeat domain-containing protein [Candidatus Edwardsbacteria bacterium]